MSEAPTSIRHPEPKEDTALAQEARAHVAESPALQLMAELIAKLRAGRFPWWTPESLRDAWGANERMRWFEQRADIRQRITSGLTGLAPKAARNKQPDFQAALVDSVVDDGDVTADQFENAWDPVELAAYAPVAEIWHRFRERMPWDQDTPAHQELVGWLIDTLLASSSSFEGMTRKPILSSHTVRTTIPGKIWHSKIPLEIRVAIDDLRFQRERAKPGEPFHAIHDLSVATPTIIATNIPLRELVRVVDVAEKAMAVPAKGSPQASSAPKEESSKKAEPPKSTAQPAVPPPPDKAAADKAATEKAAADKTAADKAAADKAAAEKAAGEKAAAEKAAADKAGADKAAAEKAPAEKPAAAEKSTPKSAIERMAEKVVEKVKEAAGPKSSAAFPPPGNTGKMGAVPAASNPLPVPAPPGEPITARGPKHEESAPESDRGDDIIVDTDDSFKFDEEEVEATGVGTKEDPRQLSKKPEPPPPPPPKR